MSFLWVEQVRLIVSKRKCKKSILETHPHLLEEWDFERNEAGPENITHGSNKKVWWVCRKEECGHSWRAVVNNRAGLSRGCPACANWVVTAKNNLAVRFPDLCKEWDYDKNNKLLPEKIVYGSSKKVWWKCSKCRYEWKTQVVSRTGKKKTGCPVCAGNMLTKNNILNVVFPELAEEWHLIKNFPLLPNEVAKGSGKKVWWECRVCGHGWRATPNSRTNPAVLSGCPSCANQVATVWNNLDAVCPKIAKEWDTEKNGNLSPKKVLPGSEHYVWWLCSKCNHSWGSRVYDRGGHRKNGCPRCAKSSSVSKISLKWLKSIGILENLMEKRLRGLGGKRGVVVDAYDPESNTVYEFLGDFWHGNPKIYSAKEVNPVSKKSYGVLCDKTIDRFNFLLKDGYDIVYIWENDFKSNKKEVKLTLKGDYPISSL